MKLSPELRAIAVRRLRSVPIPVAKDGAASVSPQEKIVVLAELARLGYRVRRPELFDDADRRFLNVYPEIVRALRKLRGGDVDYVPLFVNFPEDVPDDEEYFAKRIYGYVGHFLDAFDAEDCTVLRNGMRVPHWLFDLSQFGANPITQFQDYELFDEARKKIARRKDDSHTEWIDLRFVPQEEIFPALHRFLLDNLYARSSIPQHLAADLEGLLIVFGTKGIDPAQIKVRETRTYLLQTFWLLNADEEIVRLAPSPTDLLRLFALLTDSDFSLAQKIRYPKLNRRRRRTILRLLEESVSLEEDLWRYRGLWLAIGRALHPGEYAKRFPRTAAAFDALRNDRRPLSFSARTEALLRAQDLDGVLEHLARRPGLFARRLHELLRRFHRPQTVLDAFDRVADRVPLKTLLVLQSHLGTITESKFRTVINKKGLIKVLPNQAQGLPARKVVHQALKILEAAMLRQISAKSSWGDKKVWIDPALERFTVPLQQRTASDGVLTYGRGTQLPIDLRKKVLRLFVYWKQARARTDLDLSVIQFNKKFKNLGHVSYTRLSRQGIVHSGDIQSAALGAAEFVDVSLSALAPGVRYLAPSVLRYAGEHFADMDRCHAGWMMRSEPNPDTKTFDIKTVQHCFDLQGRAAYCIPLVVDLQERRVVLTDLYMSGRELNNNIEGVGSVLAVACRGVLGFIESRPTLDDLANLHIRARGAERVSRRDDADITFGVDDCDWNAGEPEKLLSQLL